MHIHQTVFYRHIKIVILTDGNNNYGYSIVDAEGVEMDSCEPFTGNDLEANGLLPSCREFINFHLNELIKDHLQELKYWIRNKVPLSERTAMKLPS